jgi:hypothetical protein
VVLVETSDEIPKSRRNSDYRPRGSYDWICGDLLSYKDNNCRLSVPSLRANISNWSPTKTGQTIKYCLSEIVDQRCQLQYSIHLIMVIICANIVKLFIFGSIAWQFQYPSLITVGDAIVSFLNRPSPLTERACLLGRRAFQDML